MATQTVTARELLELKPTALLNLLESRVVIHIVVPDVGEARYIGKIELIQFAEGGVSVKLKSADEALSISDTELDLVTFTAWEMDLN